MTEKYKQSSAERKAWHSMRARCTDANHPNYSRYGGKGIRVCKKWELYENFLADVNHRPSAKHSLGRINGNKNYMPSNVRWETRRQQQANVAHNVNITWNNQTYCKSEWARRAGISFSTLTSRLSSGWPLSEALTAGPYATTNSGAKPGLRQRYTHDGHSLTLTEWAKRLNVARMYLYRRRDAGIPWPEIIDTRKYRPAKPAITITYKGETATLRQWAQKTGLSLRCIRSRHEKGCSAAEILRCKPV